VVLHDRHAAALVSEVGRGAHRAGWEAIRRVRRLPPLLEHQPERGQEARHRAGREYVDGIRFTYEGGQIRSLLALLSYFGKGEMRERSLGIKIPPTNLQPDFGDQAEAFANKLTDTLGPSAQIPQARSSPERVT
jgi:hypothetical protein